MVKISTINTNNTYISKTETRVNTSNTDNIYSSINIIKTRTCGSGKKYKNCCGKNQQDIYEKRRHSPSFFVTKICFYTYNILTREMR